MKTKEIQKERIKNYYIESAKEIVETGGFNNLNIRKISERAGYSHATLYNHFINLDELLCYCIVDYQQECYDNIKNRISVNDLSSFISLICGIVEYFLKKPHVFRLIFMMEFEDIDKKNITISSDLLIKMKQAPALISIYESLAVLAEKKIIPKEQIEIYGQIIRELFIGKLVLHVSKRSPFGNNSQLLNNLESELKILFQK